MNPKIIKTPAEHQAALDVIEKCMGAKPGTKEFDQLELWVHLVEKYEEENHPIDMPDPVEAIKFRMEQSHLKQKDLIPYIGSKSKVSEILNHKRSLSLNMIRKLHQGLEIPAEVLLKRKNQSLDSTIRQAG